MISFVTRRSENSSKSPTLVLSSQSCCYFSISLTVFINSLSQYRKQFVFLCGKVSLPSARLPFSRTRCLVDITLGILRLGPLHLDFSKFSFRDGTLYFNIKIYFFCREGWTLVHLSYFGLFQQQVYYQSLHLFVKF